MEQKVIGGPEKQGMLVLDLLKAHFDTRHKSHITGSCKNKGFGEETIQRPPKVAVKLLAVDSEQCFECRWKNEEAQCDFCISGS